MAARVHILSEVDTLARTATCAKCGPVEVKVKTRRGRPRSYQCAEMVRRYHARYNRAAKYGISRQHLDELLAGPLVCGICERGLTPREARLDHDHACCTGEWTCGRCLRGVLCQSCNTGIGLLGDDPERLMKAAAYIETHQAHNLIPEREPSVTKRCTS